MQFFFGGPYIVAHIVDLLDMGSCEKLTQTNQRRWLSSCVGVTATPIKSYKINLDVVYIILTLRERDSRMKKTRKFDVGGQPLVG